MGEIAPMIKDLSLILMAAGVVTLIFKKLKQPLVLGYIVAGYLVGNHMPFISTVTDTENVKLWGEIGVMFLLFSLGLDFSFKKIVKMGASPIITVFCTITAMIVLGLLVGNAFGWKKMDCIFLGGMLAMSSTAIIYKAFSDLGLNQLKFTHLVMSVLILEDILAIVMMVMLSTIASGKELGVQEVLDSVLNIGFFLVLWLVAGIFLIPWFFRKAKSLMNEEVMLVVSLGLCCFMAVTSTEVGFSSAFGAFIMGSILAETLESEYIEKLITPVKNLFGAIFFVSVGMLVDPKILVDYALPILVLVLTIIIGQCVFGSISYKLGGETLKSAMRCGFSMTQIGEFSFIIASLGLQLGVISDFLYPVVVAVSVITTFTTPYMIRLAEPAYGLVERCLPDKFVSRLNKPREKKVKSDTKSPWASLLGSMTMKTVVNGIVSMGIIGMVALYVWPAFLRLLPEDRYPWQAALICDVIAIIIVAPFMRAMVTNNNRSEEFRTLWENGAFNKCLLCLTVAVRFLLAVALVFYFCYELGQQRFNMTDLFFSIAVVVIIMLIPGMKRVYDLIEKVFLYNLNVK